MGIFDSLRNAILGSHLTATPVEPKTPAAAAPGVSAQAGNVPAAPQAPAAAAPNPPVDIAAVLEQKAASKHEKLNWQTSIVDLMKTVDLDPSLDNRKKLAGELGYTGSTQDSAAMNVWLHQEVMQKLAAAGGKVPDGLRH